jgi:hypothetical protein
LKARTTVGQAVALERAAGSDALGVDLDADDLHVGPHPAQPFVQLDRGDRRGAVAEVDDDRRARAATQAPRLRAGDPAVAAPEPVGVRRAPGDGPDGANAAGHARSLRGPPSAPRFDVFRGHR